VVKISRRLGHASVDITLRVYAHLFRKRDDKSSAPRSTLRSLPYSRVRTNPDWCYFVLTHFATRLGDIWVTIVLISFYNGLC
jgi:hypothetical protein